MSKRKCLDVSHVLQQLLVIWSTCIYLSSTTYTLQVHSWELRPAKKNIAQGLSLLKRKPRESRDVQPLPRPLLCVCVWGGDSLASASRVRRRRGIVGRSRLSWGVRRGVQRWRVHLIVEGVWRWGTWVALGDSVDVGGTENANPCTPSVLHAHTHAQEQGRHRPHQEHHAKHDTGDGSAREDVTHVGVVGAAERW